MAEGLVTLTGTTVTHDETAGLQNSTVTPSPPGPAGDANDNDVLFDDIPDAFKDRLDDLTSSATPIGAAESAGNVVEFHPTGTLGNIALTDANGDPLNGTDSGLVTADDGEAILLYTDTTNDNIVLGKTASGDIVFAIYLEETGTPVNGGKLWTVQYEAIDHGDDNNDHDSSVDLTGLVHVTASEAQSFSFAGAPSGQNLFMMFGNSSQAIVVTGRDPANQSAGESITTGDTVNTGQGGGATTLGTNGQQIKAQQGMYFTFVTGANSGFTVPNLSQTEADVESNIDFTGVFGSTSAQFTIAQTTPSHTTLTIKISAFTTDAEPGAAFVDGINDADDDPVNITSVQINGVTVAANLSGDTAIVSGVKAGDVITYTTEGVHNRVLIENNMPIKGAGSNKSLDIGGFTLTEIAGDTDEVGSKIFFEDDGPAIDLTEENPSIVLDESVGTDAGDPNADDETNPNAPVGAIGYAAVAASALFSETADAGSDGEASKVYSLVLTAGATGLTDTASDEAVVLSDNNGVIEGRTATGDELVFTITVDAATGDVEVAQFRALDHGDDGNDHDSAVSMAAGLVELQATLTDGDTDSASDKIELGSLIDFEDDGPVLEATTDDVIVDFAANASEGDSDLGLDYGSDGPGTLKITDFEEMPDNTVLGTITETLSDGDTVLTYSSDKFGDLFQLSLIDTEPGAYTFTVLQDAPLVINVLDFGGNDPGGPVEDITITAPGGTDVTFDGFFITNFNATIKPQFANGDLEPPDPDEALEDINVSQQGIGLQDNQMDPLEALRLSFGPDVDGVQIKFDGATGGGNTFRIKVEGYDANGNLVFSDLSQENAPKGNAELIMTYQFDEPVDTFYIALDFDTPSSGVRIAEVATIEQGEVSDFELDYTVTATDEDGDSTTTDFTVGIDGNHDGLIEVA